jgi:hypothetical protein
MLDARKRKRILFLFLASSIQHPASISDCSVISLHYSITPEDLRKGDNKIDPSTASTHNPEFT